MTTNMQKKNRRNTGNKNALAAGRSLQCQKPWAATRAEIVFGAPLALPLPLRRPVREVSPSAQIPLLRIWSQEVRASNFAWRGSRDWNSRPNESRPGTTDGMNVVPSKIRSKTQCLKIWLAYSTEAVCSVQQWFSEMLEANSVGLSNNFCHFSGLGSSQVSLNCAQSWCIKQCVGHKHLLISNNVKLRTLWCRPVLLSVCCHDHLRK